eukprot:364855-Chlamydomonas_euryale.AAC.3
MSIGSSALPHPSHLVLALGSPRLVKRQRRSAAPAAASATESGKLKRAGAALPAVLQPGARLRGIGHTAAGAAAASAPRSAVAAAAAATHESQWAWGRYRRRALYARRCPTPVRMRSVSGAAGVGPATRAEATAAAAPTPCACGVARAVSGAPGAAEVSAARRQALVG